MMFLALTCILFVVLLGIFANREEMPPVKYQESI